MLGSAIPKRWVVSLALVGLVSLFMASYAAVWAGPASATTGTTAPATSTPIPTSTPAPSGSVLSGLNVSGNITIQTGQAIQISASPVDDQDNVDVNMPGVTYSWNAGSCGTLSSTTSRTPVFTAGSSACNGSIIVHANQGTGPNVPDGGATISVNVLTPPATPAPTSTPAPPPAEDLEVVADLASALNDEIELAGDSANSAAGVVIPSSPTTLETTSDEGPSLAIPAGSLPSGTAAVGKMETIDGSNLPPVPTAATEGVSSGTFKFGSSAIEISFTDADGNPITRLERPARVCIPFTQADLDGAYAGPNGVKIWHYDGTQWRELATQLTYNPNLACANTSSFSPFALGLAVEPPAAESGQTGLPATGDYSPSAMSLVLAMLAGIALVATGAFTARRARRVRDNS